MVPSTSLRGSSVPAATSIDTRTVLVGPSSQAVYPASSSARWTLFFYQSGTRQRVAYRGEGGSLSSDKDILLLTGIKGAVNSVVRGGSLSIPRARASATSSGSAPSSSLLGLLPSSSSRERRPTVRPSHVPHLARCVRAVQLLAFLVGQREDPSKDLVR